MHNPLIAPHTIPAVVSSISIRNNSLSNLIINRNNTINAGQIDVSSRSPNTNTNNTTNNSNTTNNNNNNNSSFRTNELFYTGL